MCSEMNQLTANWLGRSVAKNWSTFSWWILQQVMITSHNTHSVTKLSSFFFFFFFNSSADVGHGHSIHSEPYMSNFLVFISWYYAQGKIHIQWYIYQSFLILATGHSTQSVTYTSNFFVFISWYYAQSMIHNQWYSCQSFLNSPAEVAHLAEYTRSCQNLHRVVSHICLKPCTTLQSIPLPVLFRNGKGTRKFKNQKGPKTDLKFSPRE